MAKLFGKSMEPLMARFENLSDREKKMSLGLLGFFALLFVVAGFYWIYDRGNELKAKQEIMALQLLEIANKKDDYLETKKRRDRFESNRISNLRSYIDTKAKSLGLPTDSLGEAKDALLQKMTPVNLGLDVAVFSIKGVSIDMLTAFLEAIEGPERDGPIKVSRLNVKANGNTSDLLDASMTIASWKRKG